MQKSSGSFILETEFMHPNTIDMSELTDSLKLEFDRLNKEIEKNKKERAETILFLRELCEEFGDNEWKDDLHLKDILEKHLAKRLWEIDKYGK